MTLALYLAQVAVDPSVSWWWDTAQKIGAGASFVMGIGIVVLAKAYDQKDKQLQSEVSYSKDRDKQTLTVMLELTTLIKGIDSRDKESASNHKAGTDAVLSAIHDIKNTILTHFQHRTSQVP